MTAQVAYLGATADMATQSELNAAVANLEDLHIQAMTDLSILADQGRPVAAYKAELDVIAEQISLLKADILTLAADPQSISSWRMRADAYEKRLRDVLRRTGSDRQSAPELAQLRGFGWGLGVLVVATAVGVYVWTHRSKARRRRR